MNINPRAKRVLCFGDSNIWGYIPGTAKRYPINIRWPGQLQQLLGDSYEIIEEGLNSRTTTFDDPKHEGKNGKQYLLPCIQSQDPIDILLLMLGTNDMKERFHRSPAQIAAGIEELILLIKNAEYDEGKAPEIILIAPPLIDETVVGVKDKYLGGEEKSRKLGELYKIVADKYDLAFIDLAPIVPPSTKDGYHFETESHTKVAEVICSTIKELKNH